MSDTESQESRFISLWVVPAAAILILVALTGALLFAGGRFADFDGKWWLDLLVAAFGLWALVLTIRDAVATAKDDQIAWRVIGGAYATLVAAGYIAIRLQEISPLEVEVMGEGFQWFALLFVLALAIERGLEPFMQTKVTAEDQKTTSDPAAAAPGAPMIAASPGTDPVAPVAPATAEAVSSSRALIAFMLGSAIALILAGLLDLGLIGAITSIDPNAPAVWAQLFEAIDVVVTGLAIGAGTKPLHDLVTKIEKKPTPAG